MRNFDKRLATVVCDNGQHHVVLPSGEIFPCVKYTEVKDEVGQKVEVIIKANVNIAESVDDAIRQYKDGEIVCRVSGKDLVFALDRNRIDIERKQKEETQEQNKQLEKQRQLSWLRFNVEVSNRTLELFKRQ